MTTPLRPTKPAAPPYCRDSHVKAIENANKVFAALREVDSKERQRLKELPFSELYAQIWQRDPSEFLGRS